MSLDPWLLALCGGAAFELLRRGRTRLQLSLAKHPSLRGHARIAQFLSRRLPAYEFDEARAFGVDGAPPEVVARRRAAFDALADRLAARAPKTAATAKRLQELLPDSEFTGAYRVPFPFRRLARERLPYGGVVAATRGRLVEDLDGNEALELGGSYGVNVLGYDAYKGCIERAVQRAGALGPLLGALHPVVEENARRLCALSGMDSVSFHMSGTEAVMQAVRLARYHTRRSHVVRFTSAYHGWWDGVQPGPGNPRPPHEVYTLKEMDAATLRVLETRRDIACVLVNPIQAMHPNGAAPTDSMLISGYAAARYDKEAYARWLHQLRDVCTRRGIVLILDEVFLGFRLAVGGAQEYFGVAADLVTYGKTIAGGLPIGAVCGKRHLMKRYRDERPSDVCFARGTFHSHPYVMAAMSEFLDLLEQPEVRAGYADLDARWDGRARRLNERQAALQLPVRVENLASVFTTLYVQPSRYHWLFQYHLRAAGLAMNWIGTGRFIFSHDWTDAEFDDFGSRYVAAARAMRDGGFWWQDAALTAKAIRRRVLRELLGALLTRRPELGVEPLAAQQLQRRAPVEGDVVERVGEDLRGPRGAGQQVASGDQPSGAREERRHAERDPGDRDAAEEAAEVGVGRERPEQRRREP